MHSAVRFRILIVAAALPLLGLAQTPENATPPPAPAPEAAAAEPAPAVEPAPAPAAEPAATPAPETAAASPLPTPRDKISYAIGQDIGRNMREQEIDVDPEILARGLRDALSGNPGLLNGEEVAGVLASFGEQMRKNRMAKLTASRAKNEKDGAAFLEENKKKPGIVTRPSGLQYEVVSEGAGKKPRATDTVTVHYTGKLIDGKVFDSSLKRGEPASFPLDGVIRGWTEGLQLMTVGSKYRFFIPPELGYGERGSPPLIGPNAVLVFDVELLAVQE